jgi:hypothetical protein
MSAVVYPSPIYVYDLSAWGQQEQEGSFIDDTSGVKPRLDGCDKYTTP